MTLLPNRDDEIGADLMVVVQPEVPQSVYIDEAYIHRILMNLLSNAVKFTSSGYILLLIEMENEKLVATVKDTGPGIPPSFQPQLFEPFKQAHARGAQRGTGLGLSIIKQLLYKMQGTIDVESRHLDSEDVEPGQTGSTFTTKIPVQLSSGLPKSLPTTKLIPRVAIFHGGSEQSLAGLCTAWGKFGFEVVMAKTFSDTFGSELKYVWVDLPFIKQDPAVLQQLLEQDQWPVLVPYDTQDTLRGIPEILQAPRVCPIAKPLIWHCFEKSINESCYLSNKAAQARTVRFAPKVEVLDSVEKEESQKEPATEKSVVLLVEDNLVWPYLLPTSPENVFANVLFSRLTAKLV
jgi:Histidine kinase-, DNA gyrase B-, and HSP90-like ATPase